MSNVVVLGSGDFEVRLGHEDKATREHSYQNHSEDNVNLFI